MNNPTEGQPNHLKGPKTLAFTSSQHTKNKEPVSLLDLMCFKALDYLSEEAWGIAAFRKLQAWDNVVTPRLPCFCEPGQGSVGAAPLL